MGTDPGNPSRVHNLGAPLQRPDPQQPSQGTPCRGPPRGTLQKTSQSTVVPSRAPSKWNTTTRPPPRDTFQRTPSNRHPPGIASSVSQGTPQAKTPRDSQGDHPRGHSPGDHSKGKPPVDHKERTTPVDPIEWTTPRGQLEGSPSIELHPGEPLQGTTQFIVSARPLHETPFRGTHTGVPEQGPPPGDHFKDTPTEYPLQRTTSLDPSRRYLPGNPLQEAPTGDPQQRTSTGVCHRGLHKAPPHRIPSMVPLSRDQLHGTPSRGPPRGDPLYGPLPGKPSSGRHETDAQQRPLMGQQHFWDHSKGPIQEALLQGNPIHWTPLWEPSTRPNPGDPQKFPHGTEPPQREHILGSPLGRTQEDVSRETPRGPHPRDPLRGTHSRFPMRENQQWTPTGDTFLGPLGTSRDSKQGTTSTVPHSGDPSRGGTEGIPQGTRFMRLHPGNTPVDPV
jgi:hypothetical protein